MTPDILSLTISSIVYLVIGWVLYLCAPAKLRRLNPLRSGKEKEISEFLKRRKVA